MAKSEKMRIGKGLRDILKVRVDNFGTSYPKESENLAKILGELEIKLGIDLKSTPVFRGKPKLTSHKRLMILK